MPISKQILLLPSSPPQPPPPPNLHFNFRSTHLAIVSVIFVNLLFNVVTGSSSSSHGSTGGGNGNKHIPSPYEYTPITALNQYGQSTQLRHAQLASSRYGALTLTAIATIVKQNDDDDDDDDDDMTTQKEEVLISCTLPNPSPPGLKPKLVIGPTNTKIKTASLFQILAYDATNAAAITAFIGSGMKPDVQFLTQNLREYARRIWERYDVTPSPYRLSQAMSQVCLSFMGYDLDDEIMDGVGPVLMGSAEEEGGGGEEGVSMARPLGVHALIVGITKNHKAEMICLDPAGMQQPCHIWAMGKDGDEANKLLRQKYVKGMSVQEVKEMMIQIVKEIRFPGEEDSDLGDDASGSVIKRNDIVLPCEILSKKGIHYSEIHFDPREEMEQL